MRFYLTNSNDERIINIQKTSKQSDRLKHLIINDREVWVRDLAGKKFYSFDLVKWRLFSFVNEDEITSNTSVYKMYRGFKPSSLFGSDSGDLVTQMPGKVVKILCKEGESVKAGETLLILEAMKMENEIKAGVDGVVKKLHIKELESLEAGTLMIELES